MEGTESIKSSSTNTPQVVFAPDYREFSPYQKLLAEALVAGKTRVDFLKGYRRGMPLYRGLRGMAMDVLHMHYPAHYFVQYTRWDLLRKIRFPMDLSLAVGRRPVVYTVHDLYPLDYPEDFFLKAATASVMKRAAALIVHSVAARDYIASAFAGLGEKCTVIPHGDLSPTYGAPLLRRIAREALGLGNEKICLMFGILTANKGAEELIEFWKRENPDATLAIVGKSKAPSYGQKLATLAGSASNVLLRFGFQTDEQVRLWFSAADCAVINYGKIFTSGVASLARSYGLPVLLPVRHATVDLQEPHPSVFRFDSTRSDFGEQLKAALEYAPSYEAASEWREAIAWNAIAAKTQEVYARVLAGG